jgi:hypothetical protein
VVTKYRYHKETKKGKEIQTLYGVCPCGKDVLMEKRVDGINVIIPSQNLKYQIG